MPKLNNRPAKYCQLNGQAVVYRNGKPVYLGRYGSPESKDAYARIIAEKPANPTVPLLTASPPPVSLPSGEKHVTVRELAVEFLDYAKKKRGTRNMNTIKP